MTARILGFHEGLKVLEHVDLILKDYMPVLGEIKGNVEIVSGDRTETYENVTGYFMHSHNEFELLITGE